MEPFKAKGNRPERKIQDAIKRKLFLLGWHVMETHGNMYQSGFPDLYAMHPRYGTRWIEVKNREGFHFTAAQLKEFKTMTAHGVGVWVLTSDDDSEIDKLFGPANWHHYLSGFRFH